MVKAKKDCGFKYLLSHKAVSKGSDEKEYIGTLKCLEHTHPLHLNPILVQSTREKYCRISDTRHPGSQIPDWEIYPIQRVNNCLNKND